MLLGGAANAEPARVAALDFGIVGLKKKLGSFYAEQLSVRLEAKGLQVTTQKDIQAVLSLERQKQLLGCADDASSCAVELAGALGVEALVTGQVAKVGKSFQLNVRFLSARDAEPLYVFSKLLKNEEDLLEALDEAAEGAAAKFAQPAPTAPPDVQPAPVVPPPVATPPPAIVEKPVAPAPSRRLAPWVLTGAGAVSLATSAVFFGLYGSAWSRLGTPTAELPPADAMKLAETGNTWRWVAIGTAALGASLIGAGLAWHFLGEEDVVVAVVPLGPGVSASLRW